MRDALAWVTRTCAVRGGWRLVPALSKHFGAGRTVIRLRHVGILSLDLEAKEQSQVYWSGLESQEKLIIRWMDSYLNRGSVVIDAGANIGLLTLAAARRVDPGRRRVIAFEPHPANFRALVEHVRLNRLNNVVTERLGLSDRGGRIRVRGGDGAGNWSLASDGPLEFEIELIRLDDYIADHPLERIDLVKLDIEGSELAALRGAEETLRRFRPALIFELNPYWLRKLRADPGELLGFLRSRSYRVHRMTTNPRRRGQVFSPHEAEQLPEQAWINLVAYPLKDGKRPLP